MNNYINKILLLTTILILNCAVVFGEAYGEGPNSIEEITDVEISKYMSLDRVEDILGNNVIYTTPRKLKKTIKRSDKTGLLVLVYSNEYWQETSKRSAIIFKYLIKQYSKDIDFIACPDSEYLKKYDIKGPPSFVMYSRFDLLKGETIKNNDGRLKQVDILRGGPKKESQIKNWIKDFPLWWIGPNIFQVPTPDNDGILYRFNNTGNYQEIKGFKYTPLVF